MLNSQLNRHEEVSSDSLLISVGDDARTRPPSLA